VRAEAPARRTMNVHANNVLVDSLQNLFPVWCSLCTECCMFQKSIASMHEAFTTTPVFITMHISLLQVARCPTGYTCCALSESKHKEWSHGCSHSIILVVLAAHNDERRRDWSSYLPPLTIACSKSTKIGPSGHNPIKLVTNGVQVARAWLCSHLAYASRSSER
jgi:hypothetical protein